MGNRGNVHVHEGDRPGVFLYTHWTGSNLPMVVARALSRGKDRWTNPAHLTRIIFCEMLADAHPEQQEHAYTLKIQTTGFGISTYIYGTSDHPTIHVDTNAQTVTQGDETVTFQDLVKLLKKS